MKNKFRYFYRKKINEDIEKELRKINETGINKENKYDNGTYHRRTKIELIVILILLAILSYVFISFPQWQKIIDIWFYQNN